MEIIKNIPPELITKGVGLFAVGVLGFVAGYNKPGFTGIADLGSLAITHNNLPIINNSLNNSMCQDGAWAFCAGSIVGMGVRAVKDILTKPKINPGKQKAHFG